VIARVTESLPDDARVGARDGSDRLPFGLELLQLVGRLDPVSGVGERFGALAERQLLFEISLTLLRAVREELARLRLDRVGRLAVSMPERLGLGARRLWPSVR